MEMGKRPPPPSQNFRYSSDKKDIPIRTAATVALAAIEADSKLSPKGGNSR